MKAKLCATVTGATMAELRANRDRAAVDADLVELRLDYTSDPDVRGALAGSQVPVIVTVRPTWEGGRFDGPEERRRALLVEALDCGADYVDIEWRAGFDDLIRGRHGRKVVLSMHDFDGLPRDLRGQYYAMRATGAEVVKLAVQANSLGDTLTLRNVVQTDAGDEKRILIAMGTAGVASRVLPDRFGSAWTYAGDKVAPGQIDLRRLVNEYRFRQTSSSTAIYGVLGAPVSHSLSPVMHNAGFEAVTKDAVYLPFESLGVDDFIAFADAFDIRGVSVTAPFKESMASSVASMDATGLRVGAINTLKMVKASWHGLNTDVEGFLEPLVGRLKLNKARATVLGSGGAARSVAVALAGRGAAVSICARNSARAFSVAGLVAGSVQSLPPPQGSWDLLVNTTPVGTYPDVDATPVPEGPFDGRLVYDLVYNPPVTRLLADAAAAGCETLGGLAMLVAQAERQFEWWTGERPPAGLFRSAAERQLGLNETPGASSKGRS